MTPFSLQSTLHALPLSLVVSAPLLMAACCCIPLQKRVIRFLPAAALPAFFAAFTTPLDLIVEVPWFFMGSRMGLDETGRLLLCVTAYIWFLASFSCRSFLKEAKEQRRFLLFFLIAMAGNFGLILARDMLGYYLFFAVMSFAAYGLVLHNGTAAARKAGRIYLILVMIGEVALFTALLILTHRTGSLAIEDIAGISYSPLPLVLLLIGFGIKIGVPPLHGWVMPTYQATPIPAAAVLAGAMVNAGILGWLRFLPLGRISCPREAFLFIIIGSLAAIYGVICGLKQQEAGAVLGGSSISQMGLMTVIFGLGLHSHAAGLSAAPVLIIYIVHHALAKSSLFFGYDLIARQGKPLSHLQWAAILLPALALAGLPLTSGAIAKTAFKDLAVSLGAPWNSLILFFLPITAMATTMLMLHFLQILNHSANSSPRKNRECKAIFFISLITVATALWLWPAAREPAGHSLAGAKLWQSLWPVVGGCLFHLLWNRTLSWKKLSPKGQQRKVDLNTIISELSKILQEEGYKPQPGKIASVLRRLTPFLRRSEKILGRWKVVGFSYLALCLYLLFLLL